MNVEGTLNRDDETRLEAETTVTNEEVTRQQGEKSKGNSQVANAAVAMGGAAVGAAIGSTATSIITGFSVAEETVDAPGDAPTPVVPTIDIDNFDGAEVPIAQGITNDMSFSEAFAAARRQCGAGGVFPWRGSWYGTYYGNEWDALSPEARNVFSSHSYQLPEGYYAEAPAPTPVVETPVEAPAETPVTAETPETAGTAEDVEVQILTPEIANVDGQTFAYVPTQIDGQDVIFVDMDIDGQYDYAIVNNGASAEPSVYDISEQNIGNAQIIEMQDDDKAEYLSNNDLPDYVNDASVDELEN